MNSILIGLGHRSEQGKDEAAKAIIEARGSTYDIRRYAFADEVKLYVNGLDQYKECQRLDIPYDSASPNDDPLCNTVHGKQRRLLQHYGHSMRQEDPFFWVNKLRARIEAENPQFALITDVRYMNEFLYVRSFNGFTVKITRMGHVNHKASGHVSEEELINAKFDFDIITDADDLSGLHSAALEVFDSIVDYFSTPLTNLDEEDLYE